MNSSNRHEASAGFRPEPAKTLVPALCTQCGAALEVDPEQDAAICKYCGTPFIVQKAIHQYNIQNAEIHADHVDVHKKGAVEASLNFISDRLDKRDARREEQRRRKEDEQRRLEAERKKQQEEADEAGAIMFAIFLVIFIIVFIVTVIRNAIESKDTSPTPTAQSAIIQEDGSNIFLPNHTELFFETDSTEISLL